MSRLPQRIVCLTSETVETLYALGEQDRIAGISGYTVRPPQARKEKPKVFAFTHGDVDKILAVQPDLALTFSDLQADIARDLIKTGVPVHAFNMRSVEDILGMVETLGRLVGAEEKALALAGELEAQIAAARASAAERLARHGGRRPRVYFEEWDEPLISGIRWVSELIDIAGGEDVFAEQSRLPLARDRQPTPEAVLAAAPDIIIGSWCGKHFRPERVVARPGWAALPAVRNGRLHEIKSALILTPGPVAISDGLPQLQAIFDL
ncbi:MAG: ABC transporter substrate-binding protein [Desulfobulbus sp.]|nr:ABC transporter substrate-binding protein [Desulfobulbus sp.]